MTSSLANELVLRPTQFSSVVTAAGSSLATDPTPTEATRNASTSASQPDDSEYTAGEMAGVGVGVGVPLLIIIGVLSWLLFREKRGSGRGNGNSYAAVAQGSPRPMAKDQAPSHMYDGQFLSNDYLGPAYTLQADYRSRTNGLHAAPSRDGGLVWAIVPSPEDPGKYNICTTHNGQPKCLEIYNEGSSDRTRVCLADPGYYSGQTWSLEPQGDSRCKLPNDWTGPGWYLDTYSDSHEVFMSQGDFSGQQWLISLPSSATGGYYSEQPVATNARAPVYHNYGNSQEPQTIAALLGRSQEGFELHMLPTNCGIN